MQQKKFRLYSSGEYNIMNFDKLRYDLTSFLALELQKKHRTMLYPLARYRIYSAQRLWYEGVFNSSVDVYRIAGGYYSSIIGSKENSEAYDDEGNMYQGRNFKVKIANRPEYSYEETGKFSIPVGVPMRLSIQIDGVPQSAESIARLKLIVTCSAWGLDCEKPVRISNIPIARD